MIGKTNWTQYLHNIRRREIEIVFSLLPKINFTTGLEVGAGDGYQTTLLAPHIDKFISSDLNFDRIKKSLKVSGVIYKNVDADSMDGVFEEETFDFIFSSNVLEHICSPHNFLITTKKMLTKDGYAVHIVPSRFIKISYLLLFYPHMVLLAIDRVVGKLKGEPFFKGHKIDLENNINVKTDSKKNSSKLRKFLIPSIHGNFSSHTEEFLSFGRRYWENQMRKAGYSVFLYAKGPAFSGYGFGFNSVRRLLEYFGVSSEHIFVLKKMSSLESSARSYTREFLPRGSSYEREKFVQDWMKKEKNAKTFVKDFTNTVGSPYKKRVLDVGFGNGMMLLEFAKAGAITYGLEIEKKLYNLAEQYFEDNQAQSKLIIYDGKSFPFSDNFFDYAYSTSVLEHMSHPESVLREISRTLAPGGKFYLSFPNKYAPKESHTGLWLISWLPRNITQYILRFSKSSPLEDWNLHFISFFYMKKMARRAGLRIVYDTHSRSSIKSLIKKTLAFFGIHYGVLLKTIIIVLEKPRN